MATDASPGALPEYRVLIPDPGWEGDSHCFPGRAHRDRLDLISALLSVDGRSFAPKGSALPGAGTQVPGLAHSIGMVEILVG